SFDLPDQRICADLDPEPAHQALAGTSSEGTPYCGDDLAGSLGPLCVWGANLGERFGEDSPLAHSVPATPAPRCSRRITCVPWTGRSRRERQYQLWREREMRWQPGQIAEFWPSASMIQPWSVLNTRR